MSESGHVTQSAHSVGDVVQVQRPGGSVVTGTLIEDFADFTLAADLLGSEWAAPHRWAVALDDGTLIFADDPDINSQGDRLQS